MRLTWSKAAAWRAARHHLDRRVPPAGMIGVVARLGGVHAQVMSSAELSLWARVDGLRRDDVAQALWEERSLVKTWAMRGTLHLLPAAEYGLWQAALSRYDHYTKPGWFRGFGVTRDGMERLWEVTAAALETATLTRTELAAEVVSRTGEPDLGERVVGSWGSLLKPLAYQGRLCFGPSTGQNTRFTSPQRWLGEKAGPPVDPGEAAREVTRRYVAAYGPATREDYAHWWGVVSPTAAGRLLSGLGDEVEQVEMDGRAGYMPAGWSDMPDAPRSVRLLPAFDQYVISASPHAANLLPGDHRHRIFRPQGWLSPVVVAGGRFSGVWRHDRKAGGLRVTVEPFRPLPEWVRRGVEAEADRLAAFLGSRLALDIRPA